MHYACGDISKQSILEHVHKREKWHGMTCKIPVSVPTNDHAQSSFEICTVNFEYANGRTMLNHLIMLISLLVNILLRPTISVTPLRNLPVNKRLIKFG